MISLKHIAREMGVSTATVSNALSGKGRVSSALAERIRTYAISAGYRPSSAARALKTGQSGILGLVMPDLTNPLFPSFARHVSVAAESHGLGILIGDSRGDAARQGAAISHLVGRGVDGIIIVPQKGTSPVIPRVPGVVINTRSDPRSTVSADHGGGGRLLGAHIAGLGHRQVVLLGGDAISEVQRDRVRGMAGGLGDGVSHEILWGEAGMAALPDHVRRGATAVLATSDLLALGAHSHLSRAGYRVPEDVSLTGFDDLPFATVMHPALTTTAQNVEAIAEYALGAITRMIAGEDDLPGGHAIPMRLVVRASSAAPPDVCRDAS
ncbi:LacI family DNA-binding transcriptional regulator [Celeribacter indicus]|uniref:LacI family transcriptional regulator n=1 Tax=Celeribacter indicus TaxID=1208324 RepID=A0A0B5DWN7_9RHOB|nr:LacI family DNA-binding transcriptional regulator [Celeribacter indicus]AJE47838.1 LacI family transcriptional regulator [Celeribacter indicus]SDW24515.1 transcriptional regulator, LacI family [Celeribacter indicus]